MAVFVLFYYEQMLGLSGTLTGLAIAISILWDGIGDPLIGMWSDRLRSRIGRRHLALHCQTRHSALIARPQPHG